MCDAFIYSKYSGSTYIFDTVQTIKLWRRKTTVKLKLRFDDTEAEFKEFEPRLKFKARLKYGWFHLKFYIFFNSTFKKSEFIEFQPCLKSAKNRFQLSTGLNLEKFNTILNGTNHI